MVKKITKITPQQRGNRYNIFLDDVFFSGVTEETLIELKLKKGDEFNEDDLRVLIEKEHRNKGFDYCVWLLSRKSYFKKDLVQKLKQKEYEEEDITFIINKLFDYKYLDDERLAQAFISDKKRFSKKGPRFIQQALVQKGVDRELISQLLEKGYSDDEEAELCEKEAIKKLSAYQRKETDPYKLKHKLYGYLAGKGFSSSTISAVLRDMEF